MGFELSKPDLPYPSDRDAEWTWDSLTYSHVVTCRPFFHSAKISYMSGGYPPKPASREEWEVGYIQNVLANSFHATYNSGLKKKFIWKSPQLDSSGGAWYLPPGRWKTESGGSLRASVNFLYGGDFQPDGLVINMEDRPQMSYYNVWKGGRGGDQLRHVKEVIHFGLWIACRRAKDAKENLKNYHILCGTKFTVSSWLEIKGHNYVWAPGNGLPGFDKDKAGVSYSYRYDSDLDPSEPKMAAFPACGSPATITGKTANEVLPKLVSDTGISYSPMLTKKVQEAP
jgi:hypothetical protein